MNRDQHYAEGERMLSLSKQGGDGNYAQTKAAQATAHFLAALAAQPPLREVPPITDETILRWGS